ncbi:hypothetical protein BLNAU_15441 [Blattamonas nauphoetae]|uniref:Uncharacterized protein n=1 Tax=Blattamonas nauphoetae TaxID=2049346 RepID=A0ABQ9XAM4_9EUKA|nr:hypothetical protein BLNAU_15441 [Blattamonas nauphoetae]
MTLSQTAVVAFVVDGPCAATIACGNGFPFTIDSFEQQWRIDQAFRLKHFNTKQISLVPVGLQLTLQFLALHHPHAHVLKETIHRDFFINSGHYPGVLVIHVKFNDPSPIFITYDHPALSLTRLHHNFLVEFVGKEDLQSIKVGDLCSVVAPQDAHVQVQTQSGDIISIYPDTLSCIPYYTEDPSLANESISKFGSSITRIHNTTIM